MNSTDGDKASWEEEAPEVLGYADDIAATLRLFFNSLHVSDDIDVTGGATERGRELFTRLAARSLG